MGIRRVFVPVFQDQPSSSRWLRTSPAIEPACPELHEALHAFYSNSAVIETTDSSVGTSIDENSVQRITQK